MVKYIKNGKEKTYTWFRICDICHRVTLHKYKREVVREGVMRRYCSRSCANKSPIKRESMRVSKSFKHRESLMVWGGEYYLAHFTRKLPCEICGTSFNIHIHHRDFNHENNRISNLMWVCGACHSSFHRRF